MSEEIRPKVISSIFDENNQLIPELRDKECFLFDAYGVFWDGSKLIQPTVDDMQRLVRLGKKVCVVSNTTQLSKDAIASYAKRRLIKGTHYHEFVTSGDVFREAVLNGSLQKQIEEQRADKPKEEGRIKVYIFGNPRRELFEVSKFDIVDTPEEADCVYLSIPQFTTKEKNEILKEHPEYLEYFKKSSLTKPGEPERWDVIEGHQEIFYPFLNNFMRLGLPILNANPDRSAPEKDAEHLEQKNNVVRNGALTEYIRKKGGKVFEYGKPNVEIFEYALKRFEEYKTKLERLKALESELKKIKQQQQALSAPKQEEGDKLEDKFTAVELSQQQTEVLTQIEQLTDFKKKVLMTGDTRETDTDGSENFGIHSVLVSTGNEAKTGLEGKGSGATYFLDRLNKDRELTKSLLQL